MNIQIETERLIIRDFTADDAESIHRYFSDPEVMARIPSGISENLEKTRQRLDKILCVKEKFGYSLMAVIEKASGEIIGDCGIFPTQGEGPEDEIAWRFAKHTWGKGYATEAARAVLKDGFERFNFNRIIAVTETDHYASRKIMEKLGMKYFGNKEYYSRAMVVYEIFKEDYIEN